MKSLRDCLMDLSIARGQMETDLYDDKITKYNHYLKKIENELTRIENIIDKANKLLEN